MANEPASDQHLVSPVVREHLAERFASCVEYYTKTHEGILHTNAYDQGRATGRANFQAICAAVDQGEDVTDRVLTQLLPHTDSKAHQEQGCWIHIAPSINGTIRKWFEAAGIVEPDAWPEIAKAILGFLRACADDPSALAGACAEFSANTLSKGFQQGMLSPALNAIRPDDYLLINNKSRRVLEYFSGQSFGQNLVEYPAVNAFELALVAELHAGIAGGAEELGLRPADAFDAFCHWLIAIEKDPLIQTTHWRIAPGVGAWSWPAWHEGGYVSVAWDEFGDLSALDQNEFKQLQKKLVIELASDKWTEKGSDQAWTFAKSIRPGDRIVANQGKSQVLAVGTVTDEYYFVPGVQHGHRIPVEWDQLGTRALSKPRPGWERTLARMKQEEFEAILELPIVKSTTLAPPCDRLFANRDEAEWAFTLIQEALAVLGVKSPDDERFALTIDKSANLLTLDFGPWLVARFGPASSEARVELALFEDAPGTQGFDIDYHYKQAANAPPVVVRMLRPSDLDDTVHTAFVEAAQLIGELFASHAKTKSRIYHQARLGNAAFDDSALATVLDFGLDSIIDTPSPPPLPPSDDAAFTPESRDLLEQLSLNPTQAFYGEHKQELQSLVEQPLRSLLEDVVKALPAAIVDAMETKTKLYGRIPKNDWGRGGAWDFYWGAIYPKGGKRITDAQLYLLLEKRALRFGFSIGDYGGSQRKLLAQNCQQNDAALLAILGENYADPRFHLGAGSTVEDTVSLDVADSMDFKAWLEAEGTNDPHIFVVIEWDQLLGMRREDLVAAIADAYRQLFPLALLAISEDPLPLIDAYLGGVEEPPEEDPNPPYTLAKLAAATSLDLKTLRRWIRAIERKKQAIIYGPPGTGKTYVAERLAKHLVAGGHGEVKTVQFHPAYAYEDFIQGIRPRPRDGGGLDYPVVSGRFLQFCETARNLTGTSVLIIDEINRANLARVFGELMYLLEYRDEKIPLAAGGMPFGIPDNVRIIGTMNTADRSIALVDHALRRRFAFLELGPHYDVLETYHAATDFDPTGLIEVLKRLNKRIADHHYEVGISFFLDEDLATQLPDIWEMEIEPYLEEFFFDRPDTVDEYRWEKIADTVLKQ